MELEIYMKSGNVIKIDRVDDWSVEADGDSVVNLSIVQNKSFFGKTRKLLMSTIALSQIEAIVRVQ